MTYKDLINTADIILENGTLTLGEYEEMTKPLDTEITKRGRWIFEKGDGETCVDGYICSACGKSYHTKVPYFSEFIFCPNCGTRMMMEGESE